MTGAVIATLVIALLISVAFNAFAVGWVSGHNNAVEAESSEESSETPPAMGFRQDPDEDDEDQGD